MNKIIKISLCMLTLALFLAPVAAKAVNFDESVLKSVVRIDVVDSLSSTQTHGTGIYVGTSFLTNYHLAQLVISNPSRYTAYACVTNSIGTAPDCKIQLTATRISSNKSEGIPKYDKKTDLAILFVNKVLVKGVWKSWKDVSISELGVTSIILAKGTINSNDIATGENIYSVGYPDYGAGKTIQADGIVGKMVQDQNGQKMLLNSINISHGNSGGPVLNYKGEMVGVTAACLPDALNSNICKTFSGLFIPLSDVNSWYVILANSSTSTGNSPVIAA